MGGRLNRYICISYTGTTSPSADGSENNTKPLVYDGIGLSSVYTVTSVTTA